MTGFDDLSSTFLKIGFGTTFTISLAPNGPSWVFIFTPENQPLAYMAFRSLFKILLSSLLKKAKQPKSNEYKKRTKKRTSQSFGEYIDYEEVE